MMISPGVWNDAFARASAVCADMGIPLLDPLLQDLSDRTGPYWTMPMGAASSDRLGMGEIENEEAGQIVLVLMIPVGGLSTPDALAHCHAMSTAFRAPVGAAPKWAAGLQYDGQDSTPPDLSQSGRWYAATLMVAYRYQSQMVRGA
ncbi:hypothetical protein ACMAUO_06155 [Gluconacetobacter sp. Hr-1-5]|uniref:hypothetical protein n=1 Tax=Gluconacetobacter sp. Hr-1-5 TaxID=3395370 RepID=UPI003B520D0F